MTDPLADVWRDEWGRLLALLVAQTRRLDLAEDALADAFERAARVWPESGMPDNPPAWLMTAAKRRVLDRLRAEAVAARKQPLLAVEEEKRQVQELGDAGFDTASPASLLPPTQSAGSGTRPEDSDDLLRLVLLAAHPALSEEAGAALTLRLVLGVSTADIARLFLVPEPTMAARLTRARKKVVAAGVPLAIPDDEVLPQRLETVARVAYLAFTAGYAPGSGEDVLRAELSGEAIRLVQLVRATGHAAAESPALQALLALMLLQHARRDARVAADGSLVLLPEQDRKAWHRKEIDAGMALLSDLTAGFRYVPPLRSSTTQSALGSGVAMESALAAEYVLQALIAAEHARAARPQDTDWLAIADYYRQLEQLTGSPVVRLNRAVAVAEAGDLDAALQLLDGLDEALPNSHRLPAVRAELLARAGRHTEAGAAFDVAIERCANEREREQLRSRREALPTS
ncbi:RNA polymerase sigma factor [Flexivirga alba]|uniref:RNA polymerase sigma factor n=1 Tax=Flexivirga alba TaxID=702742 RepID=A0ABW2AEH6_9MICO